MPASQRGNPADVAVGVDAQQVHVTAVLRQGQYFGLEPSRTDHGEHGVMRIDPLDCPRQVVEPLPEVRMMPGPARDMVEFVAHRPAHQGRMILEGFNHLQHLALLFRHLRFVPPVHPVALPGHRQVGHHRQAGMPAAKVWRAPGDSVTVAGIAMAKARREHVYGLNPCFEVLRARRRTVYRAFLNKDTPNNTRLMKLRELLERAEVEIDWVDKGRLLDLSGSKEHQGAVLKAATYPYVDVQDLMGRPRLLLLDNVEDPHNVGAILRCAEVFGFHDVLLPLKGTPDVYPSVLKVSAGAAEHLNIAKQASATRYAQAALDQGYAILALDAKGTTSLAQAAELTGNRFMLVIGGEDRSVGQYILNHATHVISIPQRGRVNSLNASVAAGIAMHALA